MSPAFTAVIPLHNKRNTILRTLRSIEAQNRPADEIVVVDDRSTDGSVERVEEMGLPNLRLLHRDTPGPGGYAARNHGAEAAETEWISFLDADDEWLPEHLEEATRIIARHPEIDVIFLGRSVTIGNRRHSLTVNESRLYPQIELLRMYADRNLFHCNALVIRRDAFLASGGFRADRGWRRGGDSEFWLRLILLTPQIFVSAKVTSIYDMNYSDVVKNPSNYQRRHPVHETVVEALAQQTRDEATVRALRQLSNRKSVEWISKVPNRRFAEKLAIIRTLYPASLRMRDLRVLGNSLLTRW